MQILSRRARLAWAALATFGLLTTASVHADSITISAAAWNSARDGGTTAQPTPDGNYDSLFGGNILFVRKNQGTSIQTVYRGLYEFVLPPAVLLPGVTVNSATLTVPVAQETLLGNGNDVFVVHGAVADTNLTLDDFKINNPVGQMTIFGGTATSRSLPIPNYLQTFPGSGNSRVGLVIETLNWGTQVQWRNTATLTIDYTPPVGTPPTLTLSSPVNGAVYVAGDNILFQAGTTKTAIATGPSTGIPR